MKTGEGYFFVYNLRKEENKGWVIMLLMDRQIIGATEEKELAADSADASTLVDAALAEDDDFWNGSVLRTIRGVGVGQKRKVSDFDATSDTLTVDAAWDATPAAGTAYLLDRPAAASELFRAGGFSHEIGVEQLERAVKDASLSPFPSIPGKRSARISFTTELRGSGIAGVAPDYGLLFRACAMRETIVQNTSGRLCARLRQIELYEKSASRRSSTACKSCIWAAWGVFRSTVLWTAFPRWIGSSRRPISR